VKDREDLKADAAQLTKMLDVIFLRESFEQVDAALASAKREIANLVEGISALHHESGLPGDVKSAYGQIEALLNTVDNAISDGREQAFRLSVKFNSDGLYCFADDEFALTTGSVDRVKVVIEEINDAERRIIEVVNSARSALLSHANQGLFDWTMPLYCEFSLLFETPSDRLVYDSCFDGEPMRIQIKPRFRQFSKDLNSARSEYNWNIFEGDEHHPLRDGHHGYLVHCLFDHNHLPWQMLQYLRELEVSLTFSDFQTAWGSAGEAS
jgi:hypothetical protein